MRLLLVALIGRNRIYKIILPKIAEGKYSITDGTEEQRKLININGENGRWYVNSSESIHIIDKKQMQSSQDTIKVNYGKILKTVILSEYDKYIVQFGNSRELFILYCLPVCDNKIYHLQMKEKNEISIGKAEENDIVYNNEFVSDLHAKLCYYKGNFIIKNYDANFGTFVNSKPVINGEQTLQNGDVVFIMGLKIIIMGKEIFTNLPENKVICNNQTFYLVEDNRNIVRTNEKEENIELYSEDDYFSRVPRIKNLIEKEKVKIDAPPQIQDQQETPIILVLGSSLSMGVMMIISIINAVDGKLSGTASTKQTVFSIITAVVMLITMILFPVLSVKYDRKKKKDYEEKRQKRYKDYLYSKRSYINKIMKKQKSILYENYVSPEECAKIIFNKSPRLWERKQEDYDFLNIRVGVGDKPLEIDIQYPEEKFEMEDDNLLEILNDIANSSKILKSVPITIPFTEKNVCAIIASSKIDIDKFVQSIIIQLVTFHSYEDLKLVFFLKEDTRKEMGICKTITSCMEQ